MPAAIISSLASDRTAMILADDQRAELANSLDQLRLMLRDFVSRFPPEAQTASGMSSLLDVERSTCQRLVAGVSTHETGLELVKKLPGRLGIEMIIDAAAQHNPRLFREKRLESLRSAVRAHDALVRRHAGSQSRLQRFVSDERKYRGGGAQDQVHGADLARAREQLFDAACAVTGRSSDLWLATHVYAPVPSRPGDPPVIRQTRVNGIVGHRAAKDAAPLTFHVFGHGYPSASKEETPAFQAGVFKPLVGTGTGAIIEQFSSRPLPLVRPRACDSTFVHAIDADPSAVDQSVASARRGFDLLFGLDGASRHPHTEGNTHEEVWAISNFPARHMLFDVFMHVDIARVCVPSLEVHLWGPDFAQHTGDRWQTRLSYGPRLEMLSPGTARFAPRVYARYQELMRMVFDAIDQSQNDFIGFRCFVEYPIWRAGYRMLFDFGDMRPSESSS